VQAVPKKKTRKDEDEKAEEAKPLSWEEKAQQIKGDLLVDSAKCRTESIKLSSIPYAKELSSQLLQHASKLEDLYKGFQKALEDNAGEKILKGLVSKANDLSAFTSKAQAWFSVWYRCDGEHQIPSINCKSIHPSLRYLVPFSILLDCIPSRIIEK